VLGVKVSAGTLKSVMEQSPIITSRSNARVKSLRASFSGKASRAGDLVGIEGGVLIGEALRSGMQIDAVFCREDCVGLLPDEIAASVSTSDVVVLSKDVFDSAVGAVSPQGVAAMMVIPELTRVREGVVLMLEDLQDPGNLGTLLRSAEAFGVGQVFMTPATVNAWNPKTIRASAGSVFRVSVLRCSLAEMRAAASERGMKIFAAVASAENAISAMTAEMTPPCAVMVGNEGAGLSTVALALCDERVHIPCAIESLNAAVAGTTLLYEAFRQRAMREMERAR
jgi:TrmH family RNA methyltransferase